MTPGGDAATLRIILEGGEESQGGSSAHGQTTGGGFDPEGWRNIPTRRDDGTLDWSGVKRRTGSRTSQWVDINPTSDARDEKETGRIGNRMRSFNSFSSMMMTQMFSHTAGQLGLAAVNPQAHGMAAVQSTMRMAGAVAGPGGAMVTGVISAGMAFGSQIGQEATKRAEHLAMYSPTIMSAKIGDDIARMVRDMREAQQLGGTYARLLESNTRMSNALDKWLPQKQMAIETYTNLKNTFAEIISNVGEGINNPAQAKERQAIINAQTEKVFELGIYTGGYEARQAGRPSFGREGPMSDDERREHEANLARLRAELTMLAKKRRAFEDRVDGPKLPPNLQAFFDDPPARPELVGPPPQGGADAFIDQVLNRPAFQGRN